MSFEEALVAELAVGDLANKAFMLNAPEGTKAPYVICIAGDGLPDLTMEGYQATKWVNSEVNVIHATAKQLKALVPIVLTKLRSFQGRTIGTGGPFINLITHEEPVELYEPEAKLYRCHIRFKVHF